MRQHKSKVHADSVTRTEVEQQHVIQFAVTMALITLLGVLVLVMIYRIYQYLCDKKRECNSEVESAEYEDNETPSQQTNELDLTADNNAGRASENEIEMQ